MSNFKGHSPSSVKGDSMWYPMERGFTPTFWGSGWGQQEEAMKPGKEEKGGKGKMMGGKMGGSKHGKCPFCG